jgi:hypothetical protein
MSYKQRNKLPKRGIKVFMVEMYVKAKSSDYENVSETIYYTDKKGRVWEESGLNVAPLMRPPSPEPVYQTYTERKKQRSIKAVEAKYFQDYEKFKSIFSHFGVLVTELGSL